MFARMLGLIVSLVLASSSAIASPITYALDDTVGSLTVTGTITTDGYIGFFPTSACCRPPDILNWNLMITNGTFSQALLGPLSPGTNSFIGGLTGPGGVFSPITRSTLLATPNDLIWRNSPGAAFNIQTNIINLASMQFLTNSNGIGLFALQIGIPGGAIASEEALSKKPFEFASVDRSPGGPDVVVQNFEITAVPVPKIGAGLPGLMLLASVGFLAWWRRRSSICLIGRTRRARSV